MGCSRGCARWRASRAGRGAEAAGVGGGPRQHLGDQPDAAAVRAGGADEARRGGLLCGGGGLHAAASLRAAGEPGALPDGEAGGLLLPAAPVPGDAGGDGELRDADERRGGPDLPDGGDRRRGTWRWRSSGWWSSTPGAARSTNLERADRVVFDLDPGRGDRLAGGGGGGGACAGGTGAARARRVRQDHGRQGGARGGAGDAEARLEGGACGGGGDRGGDRGGGAGGLHHGDGSVEPEAADLHRLPPQRAERDGGGALFVAGAQQSAGKCAAFAGKIWRKSTLRRI